MDLIAALRTIFNSTGTPTRVPLLDSSGHAIGSDTFSDLSTVMGLNFRERTSSSVTGPTLFKIWEATGNVNAVLRIVGRRYTTNSYYGIVELIVGRYTSSGVSRDFTTILSTNGSISKLHLYKKHVGTTITYYVYLDEAITYQEVLVSQLCGTSGNVMATVCDEDISSLTEISLS